MTSASRLGEVEALANEIRGLCALVAKTARSDLQKRLDYYDAGISSMEHGVLRRVAQGATTMAEISRLMAVPPPTLVYVIDALVRKRLLSRRLDAKDRRREPLSLEVEGKRLLARIPNMDSESVLVKSLRQMGRQDRQKLQSLLRTFASGFGDATDLAADLKMITHRNKPHGRNRTLPG